MKLTTNCSEFSELVSKKLAGDVPYLKLNLDPFKYYCVSKMKLTTICSEFFRIGQ